MSQPFNTNEIYKQYLETIFNGKPQTLIECFEAQKNKAYFVVISGTRIDIPEMNGQCHREMNGYSLCVGCPKTINTSKL